MGVNGISLPMNLESTFIDGMTSNVNYGLSPLVNIFTFDGMFHNALYSDNLIAIYWIFLLLLVSTFFPNTQQLMRNYRPAFETFKGEITRARYKWTEWRTTTLWSVFVGILFFEIFRCFRNV